MKERLKKITFALLAALFVALFAFTLTGCDYRRYYSKAVGGRANEDMVLCGDDCNVDLLRKKLIYTLDNFDGSAEKKSELTVIYDMYNPTDEDISRKFALSCEKPSDGYSDPTETHRLTFEGKEVTPQFRYVYGDKEAIASELEKKLTDEYPDTSVYAPDMQVAAYTYEVKYDVGVKQGYIIFSVDEYDGIIFVVENATNPDFKSEYRGRADDLPMQRYIGITAYAGDTVKVYAIGETARFYIDWYSYSDYRRRTRQDCNVSEEGRDEFTLYDLVMLDYDNFDYMPKTEFFNATVDYWNCLYGDQTHMASRLKDIDIRILLIYEAELPAKTPVTLSVTTPVRRATNPSEYNIPVYTYRFENYSRWNYYGELVVEINSPYYVLDINKQLIENSDKAGVYVAKERIYDDIEFAIAPQKEALTPDEISNRKTKITLSWIPIFFIFGTSFGFVWCASAGLIGTAGIIAVTLAVAAAIAVPVTLSVYNLKKKRGEKTPEGTDEAESPNAAQRDEKTLVDTDKTESPNAAQRGEKTPEGTDKTESPNAAQRGKKTPEGTGEAESPNAAQRDEKTPEGTGEAESPNAAQRGEKTPEGTGEAESLNAAQRDEKKRDEKKRGEKND